MDPPLGPCAGRRLRSRSQPLSTNREAERDVQGAGSAGDVCSGCSSEWDTWGLINYPLPPNQCLPTAPPHRALIHVISFGVRRAVFSSRHHGVRLGGVRGLTRPPVLQHLLPLGQLLGAGMRWGGCGSTPCPMGQPALHTAERAPGMPELRRAHCPTCPCEPRLCSSGSSPRALGSSAAPWQPWAAGCPRGAVGVW